MKELNCLLLSAVLGAGSLIPVVTLFDTVHTLFAGKEQIVSIKRAAELIYNWDNFVYYGFCRGYCLWLSRILFS